MNRNNYESPLRGDDMQNLDPRLRGGDKLVRNNWDLPRFFSCSLGYIVAMATEACTAASCRADAWAVAGRDWAARGARLATEPKEIT